MEYRVLLVVFLLTAVQLGNHLLRAKESSENGQAISSKESSSEEETIPVDLDKWIIETSSTDNGLLLRSSFYGGGFKWREVKPKATEGSRWDGEHTSEEEEEDMLDVVIRTAMKYKDSVKVKLRSWAQKAKSKVCSNEYLIHMSKVAKYCGFQYGPIVDH